MATFHGGMRELADHGRPWVRLQVDAQGARLGPWMTGIRRMPTYVFAWSQVERVEPVVDRYLSGAPNAARWPDARQPVFLCGSERRLRAVLNAVPAALVSRAPQPAAAPS